MAATTMNKNMSALLPASDNESDAEVKVDEVLHTGTPVSTTNLGTSSPTPSTSSSKSRRQRKKNTKTFTIESSYIAMAA
jgi:hypothetical protein